jgi:hypothetical protein
MAIGENIDIKMEYNLPTKGSRGTWNSSVRNKKYMFA